MELSPYKDCCFCRDNDRAEPLTSPTLKGLSSLQEVATRRGDAVVLTLTQKHGTRLAYHRRCYLQYQRKRAGDDNKENQSPGTDPQTPFRTPGPVSARKKTRLSPHLHNEELCIICQKKGWRDGKMTLFTGSVKELIAKVKLDDGAIDRLVVADQNELIIRYHKNCYKGVAKSTIKSPSTDAQNPNNSVTPTLPDGQFPTLGTPNVQTTNSRPRNQEPIPEFETLRRASEFLKSEIRELKGLRKGKEINITALECKSIIPPFLKYFLNSLMETNDLSSQGLSIGQDILHTVGLMKTPKHIALATTVRHWTASKKLITLLNKLGHCGSDSDTMRIETNQANLILEMLSEHEVVIPQSLNPDRFIFGAADNINFGEITPDGKNTTNGTNMVLYQNNESTDARYDGLTATNKLMSVPSRCLRLNNTNIYGHIDTHSIKPISKSVFVPLTSEPKEIKEQSDQLNLKCAVRNNQLWAQLRSASDKANMAVPAWGAFNANLIMASNNCLPKTCSTLAYLPMLDENPTESFAVAKCLTIMDKTMAKLKQPSSVLFMDQAMYAIAKQLLWANPHTFGNIRLFMGGFHISMNYIGAIGKLFGGLGLAELLEESGLFGHAVTNQVANGKPYSRALDAHKAVYEALSALRLEAYQAHSGSPQINLWEFNGERLDKNNSTDILKSVGDPICTTAEFSQFNQAMSRLSAQYHYWSQYLDIVDLLLAQQMAERTGNWEMNIEALKAMVPVFFAADKQNYSRWLTIHIDELLHLEESDPTIYQEFMKGNFVVSRSESHFSSVSPDMALEQSINRDVKCDGGLIGSSNNSNSRDRWTLTNHWRASVSAEACLMAGIESCSEDNNTHHTDNEHHYLKSKQWASQLLNFLHDRKINPFITGREDSTLKNLVSRERYSTEQSTCLRELVITGTERYREFVKDRLHSNKGHVHDRIARLNILPKKESEGVAKRKTGSNASASLLTQLNIIAAGRPAEAEIMLGKEFSEFPPSISLDNGFLRTNDKSQLVTALQSRFKAETIAVSTALDTEVSEDRELRAVCIDAMALLHRISVNGCVDFRDLALKIWRNIVNTMRNCNAVRADVVFDSYREGSLKSHERARRRGKHVMIIEVGPQVKVPVPQRWQDYLTAEENKISLIDFLVGEWCNNPVYRVMLEIQERIYLSADQPKKSSIITQLGVTEVENLATNHDEADTKIIIHIKHALSVSNTICVICDDTDVFALLVFFVYKWKTKTSLWMIRKYGNGKSMNVLSINSFVDCLGEKCKAILGLHAIGGCDTVSSMYGVGKSRVLKAVESGNLWKQMMKLGLSTSIDSSKLNRLIYISYGCQDQQGTLNQLRYKLMAEKGHVEEKLPMTDEAFVHHIERANLQTYLWRQADANEMESPDVLKHGWQMDDRQQLIPYYYSPANVISISDIPICKCQVGCSTNRCRCTKNGLPCTDACQCRCTQDG